MIALLNHRLRIGLVVVLFVPAITTVLLLGSAGGPVAPYFGRPSTGVLDYTSPAAQCFYPPSTYSQDKSIAARIKEWIGWFPKEDEADGAGEAGSRWGWEGQMPDVVPVSGIEQYMAAHISDLQSGYDPAHDGAEYDLKLGNVSLPAYSEELLDNYRSYLVTSSAPSFTSATYLPVVLSRLSLRPPTSPLPPAPKQVLTTDKSIEDLPPEFGRWKEIMPDWEVKYFDDEALREWVDRAFGGTKAQAIWERLPRQVLKTDVFRYMAMLVEGGIYTDSDTAPIIPAEQWGRPYLSGTPPLLTHLSRLLSLSISPHLSSHLLSEDSADNPGSEGESIGSRVYRGPMVDDGAELGEPSLVISVESDAVDFGWDNWRDIGLSRAVQITQWTFMARPGHPIFLDALGRTLRKSEEMARLEGESEERGEEFIPESALEWTGPGVFTDCVYRYMLARYGFKPSELIHVKSPMRVGDVLILPPGSFSSVSPFTGEQQRPWAAVFHGFLGRWREADPRQQEIERLKKLKAEAYSAGQTDAEVEEKLAELLEMSPVEEGH